MSDPIESSQPEIIARILGAVTLVLGAIAALWRTIFGSKAERADASERAAEIALRAAEHAGERAERADEETANHRLARATCEEQLRAMGARIDRLEAEHATCGPRIAALEREQRLSRQMLDDYMRTGSTPPPARMPSRDDVRRAAAKET